MSEEKYSLENGHLSIIDPELQLKIEEDFSPVLLPSELERECSLSGGFKLKIFKDRHGICSEALLEKDGVVNGQCCLFYPGGALKGISYYKEGQLHGPSRFLNERGDILSESWYIKGARQGKVRQFYGSGNIHSIQSFVNGKLDGVQNYYFEDGSNKTQMVYCKGLLHGKTMLFFANGMSKRKINFINGKKKGVEKQWFENGQVLMEAEFNGEIPEGTHRRWHKNGVLAEERKYLGKPNKFNIRQWSVDDVLLREGSYDSEDNYTHKLWNENGKIQEESLGFWDGTELKNGQKNARGS